jgi:hypothetical protein
LGQHGERAAKANGQRDVSNVIQFHFVQSYGFACCSMKSILFKAAALQLDALDAFDSVQGFHEFVRGPGLA